MNLQSQIIIFNILFLETIAYYLSVSQSTPTITLNNQTISQFNSTFKYNTTIQIEGEFFQFLIVEFQQTSNDQSKVALLFNRKFPTFEINKTLQFKDMDYDSFALNKQNHYLLINNMIPYKFITILSNITITFDLMLTGTNTSKCLNNCNNNGKCIKGRCYCISNFIGKDCSYKATELEIKTWKNQTLSNQENSKELNLTFYTDSQKNISVLEIISSFISLPTQRFYDFQGKFNKTMPLSQVISSKGFNDYDEDDFLGEDTDNDNEDIQTGIYKYENNLPVRLIIAVFCEIPNTQLQISFNQMQKKDRQNLLVWLIPTIIGTIIILTGIIILVWRSYKKKKESQNPFTQVQSVSDDEICHICQTNLQKKKNKIVSLKSCQQNHNFHQKCLSQFYNNESNQFLCPKCPQIISNQ
ncbi:unnamed protein product [Paramecium primaurelia]|uniref:RING-type domain-containing protein n=1 Tax=Paramecium primaurelia TaxID=5886 RepID=A0A8S1Q1D4_PARPR|nr:unnamed protein product [Paramecium primaurelia]